jgi:tetratricopeptide (TPR) repeat protein
VKEPFVYSKRVAVEEVVTPQRVLWVVLLSCMVLPVRVCAQRSTTIGGHVYLEDNSHAARGIEVHLVNEQHSSLSSVSTDESGEFRFGGVRPTQYFVTIQVPAYEPVSVSVDLTYEPGDNLIIYLKPVAKARSASPTGATVSAHELEMPEKARDLFAAGEKKLYQGHDAHGAITDFQQALVEAPTYYEASYQIGMAYLVLNNSASAEVAFRKAIELSGDTYGDADVRLGALLLDRSDPEAGKFIRKGVELSPNFWRSQYELGRVLVGEKNFPEALTAAEKARDLAPNMAMVYRLLSSIHFAQSNYPALLQDLDMYIKLDPDSPNAVGAKQLREEIQQKLSKENAPAAQP